MGSRRDGHREKWVGKEMGMRKRGGKRRWAPGKLGRRGKRQPGSSVSPAVPPLARPEIKILKKKFLKQLIIIITSRDSPRRAPPVQTLLGAVPWHRQHGRVVIPEPRRVPAPDPGANIASPARAAILGSDLRAAASQERLESPWCCLVINNPRFLSSLSLSLSFLSLALCRLPLENDLAASRCCFSGLSCVSHQEARLGNIRFWRC